jgi:hypothetical protein
MTVPIDVPDLVLLASQLARPNDGARPSKPEAILEQGRLEDAALHQVDGCGAELLVACRVENERRPRFQFSHDGVRSAQASSVRVDVEGLVVAQPPIAPTFHSLTRPDGRS